MPGDGVERWRDLSALRFVDPRTLADRYAIVPGGARRKNGIPGSGPTLGVAEAEEARACLVEGVTPARDAARAAAADQ